MLVTGVNEKPRAIVKHINQSFGIGDRNGGATEATTEPAGVPDKCFTHIVGAVHDDGAFQCTVVNALFEAFQL
ncbi:hypothetical protein D3C86_2171080 [compost metagenome]